MSLPTPHIQALSTYKREWRASSAHRNISNPYNLAIPPKNKRRSMRNSAATVPVGYMTVHGPSESPTRPTSYRTKSSLSIAVSAVSTTKSTNSFDIISVPKKAFVVSEKPVYPGCDSLKSISTISRSQFSIEEPDVPKQKKKINDRILALAVVLALVLILAIAIPLGIILPQKLIKPLPVNVIVPVYGKPPRAVWDRLYETCIRAHENKFIVIVNPNHGPGDEAWPSGDYIRAVEDLKRFPNVQTIGYVDTDGGQRGLAAISDDIATYAGWSNVTARLGLQGIAFDRSPWKAEGHSKEYLNRIVEEVKQGQGFGEVPIVVLNPGRVPEGKMDSTRADVTIIYEGSYKDMPKQEQLHDMLDKLQSNRQDHAMFVNGVPMQLGRGGIRKMVEEWRKNVEWLYLTDMTENLYSDLGSLWEQWTTVLW